MNTNEWDSLMKAPWGHADARSVKAKIDTLEIYREATVAFWLRRKMAVPTFHNEHEVVIAAPIPSWVPRLAPVFAPFATDIRATGRL